ncbi:hypothetical protein [Calothrix sp. PCC 6303]|uniref:hypothetical protein n=1 Tax=Calothrix sp. PCC 6303 TaxID=1170562 RepID=UPI0002A042CF|nr:hypothetical protein [Calothrix sp. PCC 6303]AFZ03551.1 hypothetical protein Cal6303_4651 [Calothrix sp. PCC 6303]
MATSFRITGFIALFIGAYLLIPKLADGAQAFTGSNVQLSNSDVAVEDSLNTDLEIPYFGEPKSQHGSGTR